MIVTINGAIPDAAKVYTFAELNALSATACPVGTVVYAQILAGGAPFPFYTNGSSWNLCPGEYALYTDMSTINVNAGGTAEVMITSYKIPAGVMAKVKAVRTRLLITTQYTTTGNTLRTRLHTSAVPAGTIYASPVHSVNGSAQNDVMIYNAGANSQLGYATTVSSSFGNSSSAPVTSTLSDAADSYIITSLQPGNVAGYGAQRACIVSLIGG